MIRQYEGNGITTYTLRSGKEVFLSEDDFQELLGFRDEMDELRSKDIKYKQDIDILKYTCIQQEKKIKKLKKKLNGRLI
jgi:hypothetical protein